MADVTYPTRLRKSIQDTKRREQLAGFRQSNPAGGPPYFEAYSDDVPTTWQFNLRFHRADAGFFWAWLKTQAQNGRAWFNFPITTEYSHNVGPIDQEVHFTATGFPQLVSEVNDVLTYSCEVIARQIASPLSDQFIYDWNVLFDGSSRQASALDYAINRDWPTS